MIQRIVNDFTIAFATANGSGSATSNNTILRSLFKMGIPVSGKNIFPSNIQGQPTWYIIRVSRNGYLGWEARRDIVVAMNPTTFARDQADVTPGGAFYYADDIKQPVTRGDISAYPMPIKALIRAQADIPPNLRDLIGNMIYVGVLAQMLGIDLEKIRAALDFHFKHREKPTLLNFNAVKAGADWAKANLTKTDPFFIEPMTKTDGMIMADGNTAAALGSIYGGVQFVGWYPITPGTGIAESLNDYLPILRTPSLVSSSRERTDGKRTYVVTQAEDELAALGMTIGAGWGGLRAMTTTSGPGLSLMTEFAGLAYFSEVPVVIWDVQRIGPSTGLPTRTSQGDLAFVSHIGHGDSQSIILLPGNLRECFEFGWKSFDLAERIQTPVFVLSDLDLGMNQWISPPFEYPSAPMERGKVLWEKDIEELKGNWGRYIDKDGDGIPYRTLPGNRQPGAAYFLRGSGHDEYGKYNEEAPVFERLMARLKRKYETAKPLLPAPVIETARGARVGLIAYGSTDSAVQEARAQLAESGQKFSLMRVRALPFTKEVERFIQKYEQVIVIELNRDGQMHQLLCAEYPHLAPRLRSVAYQDGLPASAKRIREGMLEFVPVQSPAQKPPKRVANKKAVRSAAKKGAKK